MKNFADLALLWASEKATRAAYVPQLAAEFIKACK